jgi:hypothetical protein
MPLKIETGDVLKLKKPHPCGSLLWEVLRVGQDFRLKCCGCGRQVMMRRTLLEKQVREIRESQKTACKTDGHEIE